VTKTPMRTVTGMMSLTATQTKKELLWMTAFAQQVSVVVQEIFQSFSVLFHDKMETF